jgi:hypothetical protein
MPPVVQLTGDLVPDAIVAAGMVIVEVFLLTQIVPRRGGPPALAKMVLGSSLLLGSAGLFMSILGAFLDSNLSTYSVVLLLFNFTMVGPIGLWMIAVAIVHDRRIDPESWLWPVAVTVLATLAEVLMGLLFTVAAGSSLAFLPVLAGTLTSAWFLWSMTSAMVALLVWIPLPAVTRYPLLGLAASGAVAPWVVAAPLLGVALVAATMAATLYVAYRLLHAVPPSPRSVRWLLGLAVAFSAMTVAGLTSAALPSSLAAELAFGLVTAAVMVAEFLVLVREGLRPTGGPDLPLAGGVPAAPPRPLPSR